MAKEDRATPGLKVIFYNARRSDSRRNGTDSSVVADDSCCSVVGVVSVVRECQYGVESKRGRGGSGGWGVAKGLKRGIFFSSRIFFQIFLFLED